MPGKWGGARRVRPPRSANELGCQANGGARAGRAPPRSANDNIVAKLEKYANNLEEIVAERTQQLEVEKKKTDALLFRMLPK